MSYPTISVEVPGGAADWDEATHRPRRYAAEALLLREATVIGVFGGDEVRLRLPEGAEVAAGERIALEPNPPGEGIFDLIAEERDLNDKPIWRARIARPPADARRVYGDLFQQAQDQHRRAHEAENAAHARREQKHRELIERAERALATLEGDALEAILMLLDHPRGALLEHQAAGLVERVREPLAGEESAALTGGRSGG